MIKHPFLVMHVDRGRYVLLEGAFLFRQLAKVGLPHVPVQVCERNSLRVISEPLGLVGIAREDIIEIAEQSPEQMSIGGLNDIAPSGFLELEFTFGSSDTMKLFLRRTNCGGCPDTLQQLFRAIETKGRYLPILADLSRSGTVFKTATLSGTLKPPAFSIDDIASAVTSGQLYPPHVVSVLSDSRIFSVDFPLSVLRSNIPVEEKEAFLRDLIAYREQSYKTTFFEGKVYLLNR